MRARILILVALSGCATGDRQLQTRAAFEMNCKEELKIVQLDAQTRGVEACGRRETYARRCEKDSEGGERCEWIRASGTARVTVSIDEEVLAQALGSGQGSESSDSGDSGDSGGSGDEGGGDDDE